MLVVEQGAALALTDASWLAMLERIANGDFVQASAYGMEVGQVIGDVAELTRRPLSGVPLSDPGDPFAEIVVVEAGEAYALRPDCWLELLTDRVAGVIEPLDAYGPSLGAVQPAPSQIGRAEARRLIEAAKAPPALSEAA